MSNPPSLYAQMRRYVAFGEAEEQLLRALGPRIEPALGEIVETFYRHIEADQAAAAVITGGPAQVERLKVTLLGWLRQLFVGPWDEAYFERRAQIGRRHVALRMPQHLNFTAMAMLRERLVAGCFACADDEVQARAFVSALNRLLDLELAIILHTYSEDHEAQLRAVERLSTFGQFTSSIAHELRNPLSVIESSVYLLRAKMVGDPDAVRHLDRVRVQVGRADRIIRGMLDIVRSRPPVRLRITPRLLVERAVAQAGESPQVALHVSVTEPVPDLAGDPEQLQLVLRNLVQNAFEASGPGATIALRLRSAGDYVELVVEDDGPGVDPAQRARLFEPLVSGKSGGVGLGLTLCRKIVEDHGGTIVLQAPEQLTGASFLVRLPVPA